MDTVTTGKARGSDGRPVSWNGEHLDVSTEQGSWVPEPDLDKHTMQKGVCRSAVLRSEASVPDIMDGHRIPTLVYITHPLAELRIPSTACSDMQQP